MKKEITKIESFCDVCDSRRIIQTCPVCGGEYCWDCAKAHGKRMDISFSAGNQIFICNKCYPTNDPLVLMLKEIDYVQREEIKFNKQREAIRDEIEHRSYVLNPKIFSINKWRR